MMSLSTFQYANLAMLLFYFVGFLFPAMAQGQLTDPSTVQVGDTIWCVAARLDVEIRMSFLMQTHGLFLFLVMKVTLWITTVSIGGRCWTIRMWKRS
jgi:hypothetical protein